MTKRLKIFFRKIIKSLPAQLQLSRKLRWFQYFILITELYHETELGPLKRLLQGMTIRIEFIKLKITLTISILGYIGPNFVWILVSNHISWICWQNVDMSTKMLTSTSGLTKSCYIDLRSSKCLEASDVNKNVDMSTFSPNRIHVNMQNDCETSIVVANSI